MLSYFFQDSCIILIFLTDTTPPTPPPENTELKHANHEEVYSSYCMCEFFNKITDL